MTHPMGSILCVVFLIILISILPAAAQQSCESLKSVKIPNVTITSVEKGSPGYELPGQSGLFNMPPRKIQAPFCRIQAYSEPTSDSHIGIEIWLPDTSNWNGRFLAVGNPGFIGSIASGGIARNMERGYVSAGTDTGHVDQGFEWAIGHPEKWADWGHRFPDLVSHNPNCLIVFNLQFPLHFSDRDTGLRCCHTKDQPEPFQ